MIVTVTLNAALDVSYGVDRLVPGGSHRVRWVHGRAGGKGINVARLLHAFGHPVTVTGFAGGDTGAAIRTDLADSGLPEELVDIGRESRRTVTVVSAATGEASLFNEPGPEITMQEWQAMVEALERLAAGASVVVLSGSLPPGVPEDGYARLVAVAAASGAATIVDADGLALRAALDAHPDVVKPNHAESLAATGIDDPLSAAAWLRDRGAGTVVTTLGADGLVATTSQGSWRAWLPDGVLPVNPTGAGDACAAAIAAGMTTGRSWPDRLATAVAWSAASVVAPYAGDVDQATLERVGPLVRVEGLDVAHHHR